jgi:hypothetical protein
MEVLLIYFKPSGKWYSTSSYRTELNSLWMIWNEVEEKLVLGRLPGLVEGANEFIVMVQVPQNPHNHPHLIIKPELY